MAILCALQFVEMENKFHRKIVMMGIQSMEMDAQRLALLKQIGCVSMAQSLLLQLAM